MRTSALVLGLLAGSALGQTATAADATLASRFELGLPAEVTLVGLTAGARPELLFRPGEPGSRSRIRLAVGLFGGPEQLFLPVSLGYRACFRQGLTVQPLVGVGVELQHRFVADFPPVRSFGAYLEAGVAFAVAPRWTVGALLTTDVMFVGTPGFGFGPRAFVTVQL